MLIAHKTLEFNMCKSCGKQTINPKFCSRSCSTTYINQTHPRRKKTGVCKKCSTPIRAGWAYCKDCREKRALEDPTLEEVLSTWGDRSLYNNVRHRARNLFQPKGKPCSICGYSIHVEVCHIQPISTFPLNTRVSVINSSSNIILLCPNHHWELDHGMLSTR